MTRTSTLFSALLIIALSISTSAHADLIFSTGFNGNVNRDVGTAGTATINGDFSFVGDNVGGSDDTVIQMNAVGASNFVGLTGTGVTGNTYSVVFDAKTNASSYQTLLGPESGDQDFFIRGSGHVDVGNGVENTTSPVITDDVWHRIVLSSDAGEASLFVDGVEAAFPGVATTDPLTATIGLFRDDGNDNTVGSRFANFALYDHALTSDEAAALGGANAAVIGIPEPASVAIWSLLGLGLAGFGWYRRRCA